MFRRFWNDKRGNFALTMVAATVPIMGGLALAIDYGQVSRQRQETQNALDAAGIATAKRIQEGASDDQAKAYAKSFFEVNLRAVKPANTTLTVILPNQNVGSGTLKLMAGLKYKPYFFPAFAALMRNSGDGSMKMDFSAIVEVKLQDTIELAMVLDNSGSMSELGHGSSKVRLDLLKDAAKQLVDAMANTAAQMKQISKPVQIGLVPFASSVNVGAANATATWMDTDGISPIHHENFDWTSMPSGYGITQTAGIYYKSGASWPAAQKGQKVTRFSLFNEMKYYTNSAKTQKASYASWLGCVETRPSPYDSNDATPSKSVPATLFVPMFAPDEPTNAYNDWYLFKSGSTKNYWSDVSTSSSGAVKQAYMPKYFDTAVVGTSKGYVGPYGTTPASYDQGPNSMCTTSAITALTDISTTAGKTAIKNSIDAMQPSGATDVPEGMAWGWRVVSSGAPFTEGRSETSHGNDKVVIVITDGANTYYTPSSLGASDPAGNKSAYSALGYAGKTTQGYTYSRIFQGTTVTKTDYSNSNYTTAMNQHFDTLCANAKAAGIIVMTVALDLDDKNTTEKAQIDRLKACASESKFRKDANGNAEKNFWNTTGQDLSATFKLIANELSNLRIVG
jgi:Flp pilus assembly protein TadG